MKTDMIKGLMIVIGLVEDSKFKNTIDTLTYVDGEYK